MWLTVLEYACVMVLEHWRAGEPVKQMSTVNLPEGLKYRVEPLLHEGHPNLIHGEGGVGKSYVGAYLTLLVASPWSENGLTVEPGNVLYCDYEADEGEFKRRLTALERGMGQASCQANIHYMLLTRPLAQEIERIQRAILDVDAHLVVIDSVGPAVAGELFDPGPAIRYFAALRTLRRTTLSFGHEAKNATQKSPFGSAFWTNAPRSVWEVRKAQEPGSDQLSIGFYHRKVNGGRLHKPLGLRFAFANDASGNVQSVAVSALTITDEPTLAQGLPIRDRMKGLLTNGAMTAAEIAEALSVDLATVKMVGYRYKGKDFERVGTDGWGLAARAGE